MRLDTALFEHPIDDVLDATIRTDRDGGLHYQCVSTTGCKPSAMVAAAASTWLTSASPPALGGVPTAIRITSASPTAARRSSVKFHVAAQLAQQLIHAEFVNRALARTQQLELGGITVHATDPVADMGQRETGCQTDVAGADNGDVHAIVPRAPRRHINNGLVMAAFYGQPGDKSRHLHRPPRPGLRPG